MIKIPRVLTISAFGAKDCHSRLRRLSRFQDTFSVFQASLSRDFNSKFFLAHLRRRASAI